MANKYKLALFVCGVVVIGWIIGWLNIPGEWYAKLQKPSFNPPNWIFSPVWTVLYVLIGIVGWRVWTKTQHPGLKALWICQMLLNFAWSPAFFGMQNIGLGLAIIMLLCLNIVLFIGMARSRDVYSAVLFVPYLGWVGFATVLNITILRLN